MYTIFVMTTVAVSFQKDFTSVSVKDPSSIEALSRLKEPL